MNISILLTFPISFAYNKIYKLYNKSYNRKLSVNFTSVTHASSNIFLSLLYFYTNRYSFLIQLNSGGYYIYDFYSIIQNNRINLLDSMYLYHHITVFMYMLLDSDKYYWIYSLFFAELSNFPNYFVYYNLQLDKKLNLKKKSTSTIYAMKIQFYSYAIIRIFIIGYLGLLDLRHDEIPYIIYLTSILYIFGLIWFSFMCLQYIYV